MVRMICVPEAFREIFLALCVKIEALGSSKQFFFSDIVIAELLVKDMFDVFGICISQDIVDRCTAANGHSLVERSVNVHVLGVDLPIFQIFPPSYVTLQNESDTLKALNIVFFFNSKKLLLCCNKEEEHRF
jgi:hypothetical protein